MFSHRTEADEFFAQQRSHLLLQGLIALVPITGIASVVLTLITA